MEEGGGGAKEVPAGKNGEGYWMANDREKPEWLKREEREKGREKEKKKETREEWEERMVREDEEAYASLGLGMGDWGEGSWRIL